MKKGWKLTTAVTATLLLAGLTHAQPTRLDSTRPNNAPPLNGSAEGTEVLFRGDQMPEQGLGCASTTPPITTGGPNDIAVGVTATATAPPFQVVNFSYNLATGGSGLTALSFVAWAGGASPGAEIGRVTGLAGAAGDTGNQSMAFTAGSAVTVNSAAFYFGVNQPQTNSGIRIGLDTSSTAGTSFIRAPTCGLNAFGTVDSIGFAGNWVMAATIDVLVPVELEAFDIN